nr:helix-turn-helix domain-containing protein [uncultured Aminipila sp.]
MKGRKSRAVREGLNFRQIGMLLGRDPSTIAKEIKKHRFFVPHEKPRFTKENRCALEKSCHRKNVCNRTGKQKCKIVCRKCLQCNRLCPDFKEITCRIKERPPYVCNSCPKQQSCILDKYFYGSEHAHKEYLQTLVESRQKKIQIQKWYKWIL